MTGIIICSSSVYKYKGWVFEFHSFCGPCPLDDNGDPLNGGIDIPDEFWEVYGEFSKEVDKDKFKVYNGGCGLI